VANFPSVPAPTDELQSLRRTVEALRQGYFVLTGQPRQTDCTTATVIDLAEVRRELLTQLNDVEVAAAAPATDHGTLAGLGDNDHPQYLQDAPSDSTTYGRNNAAWVAASTANTDKLDIQLDFNAVYDDAYKEFTYVSGDLTQIDIWDTVSKVTKLYTKVFTYTTGDLTEIETTDEVNTKTLTKTFTYSGGDVDTVTVAYA